MIKVMFCGEAFVIQLKKFSHKKVLRNQIQVHLLFNILLSFNMAENLLLMKKSQLPIKQNKDSLNSAKPQDLILSNSSKIGINKLETK